MVHMTPLMVASEDGHTTVIDELCSAGQNLDERNHWGRTPLFLAAARGDLQVVNILLDKGARANVVDKQATTPLIAASKHGHIAVVERLLRCVAAAGQDLNVRDASGRTALFCAAHEGRTDVVSCLLGRGARADLADKQGTTPLMRAAAKGHVDAVRLLLQCTSTAEVDVTDLCGKTALCFAVERGHVEVVHLLGRKGARLELTKHSWADGAGTLLHLALREHLPGSVKNRLAMVKALLQRIEGAMLDRRDREGRTALHYATRFFEGHYLAVLVALLLVKGARADIADNQGMTPLMVAARATKGAYMVEMLLQKVGREGLGLDARDCDGRTALHHAVRGAGEMVVKGLFRAGANPFSNANDCQRLPPYVLRWWQELEHERRVFLRRVRSIHDAYRQVQEAPSLPLPACLEVRVATGRALPRLEVKRRERLEQATQTVPPTTSTGKNKPRVGELYAVLEFVVGQLNQDLFVELLDSF